MMILACGFFKITSSPDLAVDDAVMEIFQASLLIIFLGLLMLAILVILSVYTLTIFAFTLNRRGILTVRRFRVEEEGDYLVLALNMTYLPTYLFRDEQE